MASNPSKTLKSPTYIGLIFAQFTNSFNDQASHIIGNFFACDMLITYARIPGADDQLVIAAVTLCFILPLFLLSPLAGILADKYSKRNIVRVMKTLESIFMLVGLLALLLPRLSPMMPDWTRTLGITSASIMVFVVFLMGVQTAFLVPAKYGIMPEILHPSVLSRGNGILEGTSFVAQLFGTAFGGWLYSMLKSPDDLTNGFAHSHVWLAGLVLFALAVAGLIGAFMMGPVPAAAPNRPLTFNWWKPLRESFTTLARSRPLALAVIGIAFAAFMTLYSRQSLLHEGEIRKEISRAKEELALMQERTPHDDQLEVSPPLIGVEHEGMSEAQRAELRVSMLIALVGLGIGVGSLLAGQLSGNKLELGLVPIGGTMLVVVTAALSAMLDDPRAMGVCLILVGLSAGLYVVPLYTMLQQRAPKEQKGMVVAASNFVNVAGGIVAIVVFYVLSVLGHAILGDTGRLEDASKSIESMTLHIQQLESHLWVPKLLFGGASVMTIIMLGLICWLLPDFFTRALLYLFSQRRYHLKVEGLHHLPQVGPAILVTNSGRFDDCVHALSATDRYVHFYLPDRDDGDMLGGYLRLLSKLTSTTTIPPMGSREATLRSVMSTLDQGDIVGLALESPEDSSGVSSFLMLVLQQTDVPIIPVYCDIHKKTSHPQPGEINRRQATILFGPPRDAGVDPEELRTSLHHLVDSEGS